MPLSVDLPPPTVVWTGKWMLPFLLFNPPSAPVNVALFRFDSLVGIIPQSQNLLPSTTVPNNDVGSYAPVATAANTAMTFHDDTVCPVVQPTGGGTFGGGWRPVEWTPPFDDTNMAPGATMDPGAVVFVQDWHLAITLAGAVPGWPNDTSGVFFLPFTGATNLATWTPGGGAPVGGFGVFLNNVGGTPRYEYVSWATGGGILERLTVGAAIVPDHNNWNTVRFIVVGAASGRPAQLTVQVNGQDIAVNRDFDGASVAIPSVSVANAIGMISCFAVAGAAVDSLWFRMDAKLGRQTPAGVSKQDQ